MKKTMVLFALLIMLLYTITEAQIQTAQSGSWQSSSTWTGGVVPDSNTNVQIAAGHVITIDDSLAACKNITFADTSSQLKMTAANSVLKVYGDFTIFSVAHKAFSTWTTGAKIVFTGSALKQTLSGWNTSGSSTTFMEMVVDKDTGMVATGRQNMRFSFGTSLEIKKGIFLLDSLDDLESRTIGGTGTDGIITVQSRGVFQMTGGASHIRKGTFTDTITSRIGKMTVYGKAVLSSSSSNRMNFNGIEIMDGGQVTLNTGGSSGYFNPSTITVHSGGVLLNSTTTVVYHASAYIVLEAGGEFNSGTSTTPLPVNGINHSQGIVRFSRSSDQTIPAAFSRFANLYLSGGGIKTLGSDITITGTLSLRGTASLNLGGKILTYGPDAILQYGAPGQTTAQTTTDVEFPETNGPVNVSIYNTGGVTLHANRTITGTLTLSSGQFDNNGSLDDKILNMGPGSTIRRASGTLSVAPAFAVSVNVAYISTLSAVTTGSEIPASSETLHNLTISSTKGVELGSDVTVNGNVIFEAGAMPLSTAAHTLTLAGSAGISGENTTTYIKGVVKAERNIGTAANDFGGIGCLISSGTDNLTSVTVTRTAGAAGVLSINGKQSIARNWNIVSGTQPAAGRTITFSWPSADDNAKQFSSTLKAKVMQLNNTVWQQVDSVSAVNENDPRSISVRTTSFSQFAIVDTLDLTANEPGRKNVPEGFVLSQNFPNPFNPSTVITFTTGAAQFVHLQITDILGKPVVTLINQNLPSGSHQVSFDGSGLPSGVYFAVVRANNTHRSIKMLLLK